MENSEIKVGDWCKNTDGKIGKVEGIMQFDSGKHYRKIYLGRTKEGLSWKSENPTKIEDG